MWPLLFLFLLSIFLFLVLWNFKGPNKGVADKSELIATYKYPILLLLVVYPISVFGISFGLSKLLSLLAEFSIQSNSEILYSIRPGVDSWSLYSLMYSTAAGVVVAIIFIRTVYDDEEGRIWRAYNFMYGFNAAIALKWMAIGILLYTLVQFIGIAHYSVDFGKDRVVIHEPYSLVEKEYGFEEITAITKYEFIEFEAGLRERPHYRLDFADGFEWSSIDNRDHHEADHEVFKWLSETTMNPILEIETFKK